ncbi:MAG: hypothetical protein ACI9VR_003324 [Cognaticolwellia sp.]|jgi:hypothetical protein
MLSLLICAVSLAAEPPPPNVPVPQLPAKYKLGFPLGMPQFAFDRTGLGLTHAGLQLGSIAGTVLTTRAMVIADEEERYEDAVSWRFVSAGTTAVFAVSYFASVLMGSRDYQIRKYLIDSTSRLESGGLSPKDRAQMASSWQNSRAMAAYL